MFAKNKKTAGRKRERVLVGALGLLKLSSKLNLARFYFKFYATTYEQHDNAA